ncbi:hemerythrin domain-containing protein [Sporosarcina pasteurii]|uniref:Uncharacterized conserved protein n=1 Tax=Sporosarcina pasteurii TaxID=1474 RepID=A0A380C5H7_SPOPA|nr:hemerythrin domain-containing protein [Sporosarcina pasteurii]MDS9471697.1 hemerythrin domain-containing protein [Sporosarcina pasteurii]QBQ04702.1 hypothetical protein E2C16_02955 [Sporosarcina pasteurii]SUJ12133.1 Uncharacterized conserved protein [Sporosarcina pasteurii]
MSGPALRQLHAHRAIHEGGLSGAVTKTEELIKHLREGETEAADLAADDLLSYWQTRIISHADAEEEGFYLEVANKKPELQETITKLTRDHDLLRVIVKDIEELREKEGLSPAVLQKFYALQIVNEIHSRDEERYLFNENE